MKKKYNPVLCLSLCNFFHYIARYDTIKIFIIYSDLLYQKTRDFNIKKNHKTEKS